MARQESQVELGLLITDANSDTGVKIIQGAGAPGGDAGQQDAALVGTAYLDRTSAEFYLKDTSGTGTDKWVRVTKDDYLALLAGITEGDVDLSTFTGSTIADNRSIKQALQDLETSLEAVGAVLGTFSAVTLATVVDTMLVDNFFAAEYFVYAQLDSDPTQRRAWKIICTHDGATGDATVADFTVVDVVKTGSFNVDTNIVLAGVGAAQTFGLEITAAAAISGEFRREAI